MVKYPKLKQFNWFQWSLLVLVALGLSACTSTENVRSPNAPVRELPTDNTGRVNPETQARITRGQQSAVRTLMRHSRRQVSAGNLTKGAVFLERALKISPEDPVLWSNLAEIRFKQNQLKLAESLALKSNSYAGNDRDLLLRNWKVIAEARSLSGDKEGAEKAAAQVDKYQR